MSRLQAKERPDCDANANDSGNGLHRTVLFRLFIRQRTGLGGQNHIQKNKRPDANNQIPARSILHTRTLLRNIKHRQEVAR